MIKELKMTSLKNLNNDGAKHKGPGFKQSHVTQEAITYQTQVGLQLQQQTLEEFEMLENMGHKINITNKKWPK